MELDMNTEAKIIIAFLFNRSGKTALKDAEIYLPLSMELGWLSTKESQAFVKYAISQELLVKKEGLLHPNFPLEKITIPLGFTPSKKLFSDSTGEQKEENIIEGITAQISIKTNHNQKDIQEEIKQEEKEKNLLPAVAALYVARKHGVDVSDWYDSVENTLIKENRG
jgi:hypothetical protein